MTKPIFVAGGLLLVLAAGILFCSCGGTAGLNPVQIENAKKGDNSWQLSKPALDHEIEGYASAVSVSRGEEIAFFVNTKDRSFFLEVFRMGWYGGAGARKVQPTITLAGQQQLLPATDPKTGLIECHWKSSYTLSVPANSSDATNWASGIYLVKLTGAQSAYQNYIIFVVRDDSRHSDLLFQSTVTTYQAYNDWGGLNLYGPPRAYKVSFDRPYRKYYGASAFFLWEYFMVRFLERNGYDVSYSTDVDTDLRNDLLLLHKGWLSVGHDEYWSWQMRDNVEAARDSGVNLAFFSSNTAYWQVRFEPNSSGLPNRTMVCYKQAELDPYYSDGNADHQHLVTVRFRDEPVNRPEDALLGVMYEAKMFESNDMVVSDASNWIFANTGLMNGSRLPGLLGYEADRRFDDAPPNTTTVTHSPFVVNGVSHNSDMTVYTTAAGSTVVATGTMQWNWGLDDFVYYPPIVDVNIPYGYTAPVSNPAVQQATRNILDRFTKASASRNSN
jgi:hypothetical protein